MKKLSLINLQDYPRNSYSAYWEIFIHEKTWEARIISYDTHKLLEQTSGTGANEEELRKDSQSWVKEKMESHRRPSPLKK